MSTHYDVEVGEMDETASVTDAPRTAADYRAAIEAMLTEIRRSNEQSERTWSEIERLKAESVALQAENEIIKARIDRRLEALAGLL
jgi:peptidoglycan hydrolase CwlO-like protein